jgi:signal transduction histidine kinase
MKKGDSKKRNTPQPMEFIRALGIAFAALYLGIIISFFAKDQIYKKTGTPPLFADLLVVTLIAFVILFLFSLIVRLFLKDSHRNLSGQFLVAMDRIAQGDFSVRVGKDIPGRHPMAELAERFNTMAIGLDKVEQLRKDFVSNVSHEIQSPLTSIRGFAQALRKEGLTLEDHAHYLDVIEEESMRLSKLGDSLIKLAALESEQVQLTPQKYRLDEQLRKAILACEPQWSSKKLDLSADLAELSITADPELLGQVWANLLHNSIKFTPEGGSLHIALKQTGAEIEVNFTDTGIGIAADDQPRIFERFFKADKARRSSEGGSGLGLSIVKKIIDLHEGTIQVSSQIGQGTSITVRLKA